VARSAEASSPALTAENAAALLVQELWQRLPRDLVIDRLVLTAPVEGYREYRRWLMETMVELQVPEVALVDEPTAAAIGAGVAAGSRLLVLDLGGGTVMSLSSHWKAVKVGLRRSPSCCASMVGICFSNVAAVKLSAAPGCWGRSGCAWAAEMWTLDCPLPLSR